MIQTRLACTPSRRRLARAGVIAVLVASLAACAVPERDPEASVAASVRAPSTGPIQGGATDKESMLVPPLKPNARAFAYVVISVSDMDQALGLWVQRFGMQPILRREGTDPALARVWGLGPQDILDQALLVTPGMTQGGVHLVRFRLPGPAVRDGALPTDSVPKSVDIAVRDISSRYAELKAAGFQFRSAVGKLETDGVVVYEVHMNGPDSTNLVLLEQLDRPQVTSPQGFGIAPQIVVTTPDNLREKAFFQRLLDLQETSYHRFAGAAIEKTVGLPKGAGLDIRILGDPAYAYGRLEFVQYEGVKPNDLYPRSRPPARGMLSVTYFVDDFDALRERGAAIGLVEHGRVDSVFGATRMASAVSPTGLRIDLVER
jgi:catechol 2,3-dioxygenase-like lactoylglutathione lyase family enzyme